MVGQRRPVTTANVQEAFGLSKNDIGTRLLRMRREYGLVRRKPASDGEKGRWLYEVTTHGKRYAKRAG